VKIAISCKGDRGLDDEVSEVFARAPYFAIVDVEDGEVRSVRVFKNPVSDYSHGVGPIIVERLANEGVELVITSEVGVGASALLKEHNIGYRVVEAGKTVREAVSEALSREA